MEDLYDAKKAVTKRALQKKHEKMLKAREKLDPQK